MDNYMNLCLELIALRGDAGIPVSQLWGLLTDVIQAGVVPEGLKQAIWTTLIQSEDDISFIYPGSITIKSKKAPAKSKKKRKKDEDDEEAEGSKPPEGDGEDTAGPSEPEKTGPVERGSPELATHQTATDANIHVMASVDLQDAALGLYDVRLTRFQMSDVQRTVLSMIGAAGTRGAFQNELANAVGQENRNFFYVIKNLEQRGLVTKRPAIMHASNSNNYYTSHVQTNIIHLVKFAPDLAPGARVTDGKACTTSDAVLDREGSLGVLDDSVHLSRICNQLSSLDGKTALESELKVVLDFRGTKGHRHWRRLRALLLKKGYIQEFIAYHQEKPVKCIRLLKEYTGEAEGEGDGEDEEDVNVQDLHGLQVAEQTLDRQLLGTIIRAGDEGVTTNDLDSIIRINMKRAATRLKELEKRFEKGGGKKVVTQSINQGRTILNRLTATPALLSELESMFAPLVPPGGWLKAVEDAIEAGLDEVEEFPNIQAALAGHISGAGVLRTGPGGASGSGLQQQQQQKQQKRQQQSEDEETESEKDMDTEVEDEEIAAVPAVVPPVLLDAGKKRKRKVQTLIATQRKKWLVDKVQADGFMLMAEVGRFLKNKELESGALEAVAPDRKVYGRVIEHGIEKGELMLLSINFPAVHGSLRNRAHTIVARPGTQHDEVLVNKVWEHYRSYQKHLRSSTHIRHLAEQMELKGQALPTVAPQPLLPSSGTEVYGRYLKADMLRKMMENGLLPARMPRVRVIHDVAVAAAAAKAAAGNDSNSSDISSDSGPGVVPGPETKKKMFVITNQHSNSPLVETISTLADLQGKVLTSEGVWRALTVPQFLAALGSSAADKELLGSLTRKKVTLGELSKEELTQVVGPGGDVEKARSRLTQLLDIMVRMGILSAVVPVGPQASWTVNTSSVSIYALRDTACYEEPLTFDVPAGDCGAGTGEGGAHKAMRIFNVSTPEGRDGYWLSLRLLVARCAAHLGRSGDVLSTCFPFNRTPEAGGERCWTMKAPEHRDQAAKAAELLASRDPGRVDWAACADLAKKLNLDYEVIMMWVRDEIAFRERKVRPQRLGGLGPRHRARIIAPDTLGVFGGGGGGRRTRRTYKARRRTVESLQELQPGAERDKSPSLEEEEEEEEEESAEEQEESKTQQPLQRKVLWTAEEDRTLLRAWAKWLAASGPDKLLYWGHLKDKPPGLRPGPIKRRLRFFARDPAFAALTARVRELSADVFARRVLRHAAVTVTEEMPVMGNNAATEQAAPQQQQQQEIEEDVVNDEDGSEPAAKRVRFAAVEQEGEKEEPSTLAAAAVAPFPSVYARSQVPSRDPRRKQQGSGTTNSGTDQQEEQVHDHPEAKDLPMLWVLGDDPEDLAALKEVCVVIERIVAAAPKRKKEKFPVAGGLGLVRRGKRGSENDVQVLAFTGALSVLTFVPNDLAAAWRTSRGGRSRARGGSAAATAVFDPSAVRAAVLRGTGGTTGHAAGGMGTLAVPALVPSRVEDVTLAVEVAIELICALVLAGLHGPDVKQAISERFTQQELAAAAHEMLARGLLTTPGGCRPSEALTSELGSYVFIEEIFTEAEESRNKIQMYGSTDAVGAGGGTVAVALGGIPTQELELSMVLQRVAGGRDDGASIRTTAAAGGSSQTQTQGSQPQPQPQEQEQGPGEGEQQLGVVPTSEPQIRPVVRISQRGSTEHNQNQQQQQQQQRRQAAPHRDQVFFQPSMVAALPEIRAKAETACAASLRCKKASFKALVKALTKAGDVGLTQDEASTAAALPSSSNVSIGDMLRALCKYGIARKVESIKGRRWVSAAASQRLLAWPCVGDVLAAAGVQSTIQNPTEEETSNQLPDTASPPLTFDSQNMEDLTRGWEKLALDHALPPAGTIQPLLDVPIRPWTDHKGTLLRPLWTALLKRVVTVAMRHPGIPEDLFLESMRLSNPRHGREVIKALHAAGVLSVESLGSGNIQGEEGLSLSSPKSVLAACFASGGTNSDVNTSGGHKGGKYYNVVPTKCLGPWEVLPPHVKLPEEAFD